MRKWCKKYLFLVSILQTEKILYTVDNMMKYSKNIQLILDVLEDEVSGRVKEAAKKIHPQYTNTYMNNCFNKLFNRTKASSSDDLEDIYKIKGRKYEIYNITESENVVITEMIESYPDSKTGKIYRTPQVVVSEFKDGLIKTGRHYNDPSLSFMHLTKDQTDQAFINSEPIIIIE